METIAISNSSSNSKTNSNIEEVSSPSPSPMKPPPSTPPLQERLQRLHSGASVVLDPLEPGNETESRKLSSSKYKGVVPQPNGRWGAQIYEKHQRVWLGTFNKEVEAAQVYDIAAQRFRGRDAVTNFKPLSETNESDALVLFFLDSHSKAEIVDMLRKHTYHEEIQRSWITSGGSLFRLKNGGILRYQAISGISTAREHLFDKVVTPSDVGKLNRLVVPKQHAEKYFPLNVGKNSASNGVLLNFEDSNRKVWRFRYSYWNSSQSYVLTKGWSRFVKEKGLRAGDIVSFHRSNGPDRSLHIDWKRRSTASVGGGSGCGSYRSSIRVQPVRPVEVVRLFGVNIVKSPEPPTVEGGNGFTLNDNWSGKRRRELELLPSHCFTKKQHVGMGEKIVEKERRKEEDIKV